MIYLDSAATSYYRPREVAQAVYDAILTMGNAGRGSHTSSLNSARMIYETRCLLNELFHGPGPEQVVFTSNATEALNIAIQGLTAPGVRMAATAMDHNSVLRPVYLAKERGCSLQILDVDEKGRLSLEKLEELFQNGVDIFACTCIQCDRKLKSTDRNRKTVQKIRRVVSIGCVSDSRSISNRYGTRFY